MELTRIVDDTSTERSERCSRYSVLIPDFSQPSIPVSIPPTRGGIGCSWECPATFLLTDVNKYTQEVTGRA